MRLLPAVPESPEETGHFLAGEDGNAQKGCKLDTAGRDGPQIRVRDIDQFQDSFPMDQNIMQRWLRWMLMPMSMKI